MYHKKTNAFNSGFPASVKEVVLSGLTRQNVFSKHLIAKIMKK